MTAHFPEIAETPSALLSARHMVARPHLYDHRSLKGACEYMLMRGDHLDCVRANVLEQRLEIEAENDVHVGRTFGEIARDVSLIEWAFGAAIMLSIPALYFLISVFERMTWVGAVQ